MLLALLILQTAPAEPRPIAPIPAPGVVDGWAATVAGQAFDYHSARPEVRTSLLVRSLDSTTGARWRTAPAKGDAAGAGFAFLAAMDVADPGQTPVEFHLLVNGRHRLRIPQPTDTADWSINGESGVRLSFHRLMVDKFGDVHGRFILALPASMIRADQPAEIEVHGTTAGRMSWFILYLSSMAPSVTVAAEQALLNSPAGPRQSVRLEVWNPWAPLDFEAGFPGRADTLLRAPTGAATFRLGIEPVTRATTGRLRITAAGRLTSYAATRLEPVVPREFHLINHAHLDIGYTATQEEVLARTWAGYDSAIALAERTRSYPDEARFRYDIEGLWPLDELLERDPARAARVLSAVRRGDLSLNATYANLMMGLASARELDEMLSVGNRLRAEGLPITTAILSDVPGAPAALVPVLARAGVRWFSTGPNYQPALPMSGDRIGHTIEGLGDRPFWWESLDGRDSVLVMMAGRGYSWMHRFPAGRIRMEDAAFLTDYAARLSETGYSSPVVQLRIAFGGDNGMPDARLPDEVRRWNEVFASPRLVISTLPRMFARYEAVTPTIGRRRGDFTGYWEDGAMSTAREEVLVRRASARLEAAIAEAGRTGASLDSTAVRRAWKEILLWREHTWGADRSITEPDAPDVVAQWRWKQRRAELADSLTWALWRTAAGKPTSPPTSETRTVRNPAAPDDTPTLSRVAVGGDSLSNGLVTVRIDRRTGAIRSLRWEGRELADAARGGLAWLRYLAGRDTSRAVSAVVRSVSVERSGPANATIRLVADAPGIRSVVQTISLEAGTPQVTVEATIDKLPVREKESVHLGFAFAVPDPVVRLDPGGQLIRADADQLAAANRNLLSAASLVDVSGTRYGVTIATPDAPLWQRGGLTAEAFKRADGTEAWLTHTLPGGVMVADLMNNYWHTNFKADQEGPVSFRFVIRPHGPFDPAEASAFAALIRRRTALTRPR
ncbi:MAG: hypothetical protein R2882_00770 [Gemmatimonadales bacterium]